MKKYKIELIDKKIAKKLIIDNHYSHKWSSCRYALGLILDDVILGVAVYGYPVGRRVVKSISPLLENDNVLELTRLWVHDSEGKNTESYFIGQTFKWLRENAPNISTLISYADPSYGHVGYIYQATNWLYQGNNTMLVKAYKHRVLGEWYHPRSCNAKFGTIKVKTLTDIDPNYKREEILKKHRYVYILNKKLKNQIMNTLKHPVIQYPKSDYNCEWNKKIA